MKYCEYCESAANDEQTICKQCGAPFTIDSQSSSEFDSELRNKLYDKKLIYAIGRAEPVGFFEIPKSNPNLTIKEWDKLAKKLKKDSYSQLFAPERKD